MAPAIAMSLYRMLQEEYNMNTAVGSIFDLQCWAALVIEIFLQGAETSPSCSFCIFDLVCSTVEVRISLPG